MAQREILLRMHPTTKPVELVGKMIQNSTHPADVVYDRFAGSSTTLLTRHQLHRIISAVDKEPYGAVAIERFAKLGLTPRLICSVDRFGKSG
jgi:DNA modification methylase